MHLTQSLWKCHDTLLSFNRGLEEEFFWQKLESQALSIQQKQRAREAEANIVKTDFFFKLCFFLNYPRTQPNLGKASVVFLHRIKMLRAWAGFELNRIKHIKPSGGKANT